MPFCFLVHLLKTPLTESLPWNASTSLQHSLRRTLRFSRSLGSIPASVSPTKSPSSSLFPIFRPLNPAFTLTSHLDSTKSTDGGGLTSAFSDRLSSLLAAMHAAPSVWSIGISAQNLGQSLTPPPPSESSVQMPVVIIDRVCSSHTNYLMPPASSITGCCETVQNNKQTLDVVPCITSPANAGAFEVIATTLPRSGSCDVCVPLGAIFGTRIEDTSLSGSLAHPDDSASKFFLDPSLTRPFPHFASSIVGFAKLTFLIHFLQSLHTPMYLTFFFGHLHSKMKQQFPAVIKEPMKGAMSADTVSAALGRALTECGNNEKWVCEHPVLTDWACAVHHTASVMNSAGVMYDTVTAIGKALIPLCATTTEDLTAQVIEILSKHFETENSSETAPLPLGIVLSLLAMLYSLLGRDAPSRLNKAQLEVFLLQFIIDSPTLGIGDVSDAKTIIDPAFALFEKLAQARTMCRSLGPPLVSATTGNYCGVVELVLNSVLSPSAAPLDALLFCDKSSAGHNTGMGGLLRKGFSAFGLAGSPTLPSIRSILCPNGDETTLTGHIMFVFPGGISLPELLLIRERCAKHRGLHVHIVASALLTRPLITNTLFPVVSELNHSSHQPVSS